MQLCNSSEEGVIILGSSDKKLELPFEYGFRDWKKFPQAVGKDVSRGISTWGQSIAKAWS